MVNSAEKDPRLHYPDLDLNDFELDEDAVKLISEEIAREYRCIPMNSHTDGLIVAVEKPAPNTPYDPRPIKGKLREITGHPQIDLVFVQKDALAAAHQKYYSEESLESLSDRYGCEAVDLSQIEDIPEDTMYEISKDSASRHFILPIEKTDSTLTLAVADPSEFKDGVLKDLLEKRMHYQLNTKVAKKEDIQTAIERFYTPPDNVE